MFQLQNVFNNYIKKLSIWSVLFKENYLYIFSINIIYKTSFSI